MLASNLCILGDDACKNKETLLVNGDSLRRLLVELFSGFRKLSTIMHLAGVLL